MFIIGAVSRCLLEIAVAQGSHSATWYSITVRQSPLQSLLPPLLPQYVLNNVIRLRLGYLRVAYVCLNAPERCSLCLEECEGPLLHYFLLCPATTAIHRHPDQAMEDQSMRAAHTIATTPTTALLTVCPEYPPPH